MLDLHNHRFLLSELLEPPAGYVFSYALASTYSLDLNTLLTVPLKLLRGGEADPSATEIGLPMLQALREQGRQLRVFCQHGRILPPQVRHPLLCWLEEIVVQVPPPVGGSFHPKLWVVRYEEREGAGVIYRCLVGSRNLTYDQSADVMASIDGRVGARKQEKPQPLVRFFSELCRKYDPQNDVSEFLDGLSRVAFSTEGQFDDFDFLLHEPGTVADWLPAGSNGGLVISPFLSQPTIRAILQLRKYKDVPLKLVSRKNELARLSEEILGQLEAYHLKDGTLDEFADPELTEDLAPSSSSAPFDSVQGPPASSPEIHDIHAKFYAFTVGNDQHLYLGSANATRRAHEGRNVEAMLHLHGRKLAMNRYYLALSLNLDGDNSLFQRYVWRENAAAETDSVGDQLDAARDQLASHLEDARNLRGELETNDEYYRLKLFVNLMGCPSPPPDIKTNAWHLYRPNQAIALSYGAENQVPIDNLNASEVSRWVVFELVHEPSKESRRFLLLADLDALPERRDDLILSGMFRHRDAFFGYLHLLLYDQETLEWTEENDQESSLLSATGADWGNAVVPLFEDLARQLALAPEKITRVDEFISLMERDDRIGELELEEFLKVWRVFREAAAQLPAR
jgi:hypothetical protein